MAGKTAIMVSGLRLTTETAMPVLREIRLPDTYATNPLLDPRKLMKFAMEHFHPEVGRYCFNSSYFTQWPLVCLWPVGDEGVLDRSFHLHPLVLDMRSFRHEALSTLDYDTIDGAFVFHAFPDWSKIYVGDDSDQMLVFSFSSIKEAIEPLQERRASPEFLRATAYMFNVNPLHRSFFDHAIKLHTGDLNDTWLEVERSTADLSKHFRFPPRQRRSVRDHFNLVLGRLAPNAIPPGGRWQEYQASGIQRGSDGDYAGAAEDFAHAIRIGPPNASLHFLRGVALVNAGEWRGAVAEFKSGLKLDPTNAALRGLIDTYRPNRVKLFGRLLGMAWQRRKKITSQLVKCLADPKARAWVRSRTRLTTRSVLLGRWFAESPDNYMQAKRRKSRSRILR